MGQTGRRTDDVHYIPWAGRVTKKNLTDRKKNQIKAVLWRKSFVEQKQWNRMEQLQSWDERVME